jgi:hypothetical protein
MIKNKETALITHIPALSFISNLSGTYSNEQAELHIVRFGYGISLDLKVGGKATFAGVIGACRHSIIECYALFGIPNVIRLEGDLIAENVVQLKDDDSFFRIDIKKQQAAIIFDAYLQEQLKKSFTLAKLKS